MKETSIDQGTQSCPIWLRENQAVTRGACLGPDPRNRDQQWLGDPAFPHLTER